MFMITFKNLKKGVLVVLSKSYTFELFKFEGDTFDSIDIDAVHFLQKISSTLNCLILIKKIETNSISQQKWFCFCNGKICKFTIFKSDLIRLNIIK